MENIKMLKFHPIILLVILTSCSTTENKKLPASDVNQGSLQETTPSNKRPEVLYHRREQDKQQNTANDEYCYYSCPAVNARNNQLINHSDYILSYNKSTKYADWVAYKIDKAKISGLTKKRVWRADPKLAKDIAMIPADYKDAYITCNYDRGHQVPLADFSNSAHWEEVNYLSNITPQSSSLNQGPWNRLEAKIRSAAKDLEGDLYVITGTYYNGKPTCKLPYARITNIVPNGYWKVVTLVKDSSVYTASFKFDQQTPRNADLCKYQINLKDLEKLITYPLNLPIGEENSRELLKKLGCKK